MSLKENEVQLQAKVSRKTEIMHNIYINVDITWRIHALLKFVSDGG